MIWQKISHSRNLIPELIFISIVFISIVLPFDLKAAVTNRDEIKNILFSIKQKYQALTDKEESLQSQIPPSNQVQVTEVGVAQQTFKPAISENAGDMANQTEIAPANDTEFEGRFAVGEELILSINIGTIPLGDIFAIKSTTGVKVGLSEFFMLVDFAIDVDIDNTSAQGWFTARKNSFSLSSVPENTLQVKINNRQFNIPASRFILDDDIYVEISDIADWFYVATEIDEARLVIDLITSIPFPIENQLKRRGKQFANSRVFYESVLPLKDSDYELFSAPLLDMQFSTIRTSSNTASSYSILSSQDAAYFSSQLFLHGNDANSLTNARVTLSRQSKQGNLLGPLNMTEYAFGDVTPVNIGVGSTQALGRGVSMSNATDRLVDNRQINLVGEIQIGWDVELYRNGVLIDTRINVDSGRYEFNDVALSYGSNNFELVLYGAQGQIERRTESHYVDTNALDGGQGIVQLSVVDNNRSVFGVGDSADDPSKNGAVLSSTYEYGVTDWLSLGGGASIFVPEQGGSVQGLSLKSNVALGTYGLLNSVFQLDDDERRSMLHSFRTKIADVALDISYRQDKLISAAFLDDNSIERSDTESLSVRMSGSLFETANLPLNYENIWAKTESVNGNVVERLQNSIGMNTRWGSFSHDLEWQRSDAHIANNNNILSTYVMAGSVAYRTRIGRIYARVFSNYQIKPVSEVSSIGSTLNYAFTNNLNSELRYSYNVVNKNDRYDLRLNWRDDAFTFSGSANYDSRDDWSMNLNVRFGLGYDAQTDTVFSSGRTLGRAGAVIVRMFEDENLDQQYTEGEAVLDNVSIKGVQSFREETTSEDGIAVLKSLSTARATDIVVDESTFSEPSMMVSGKGFSVAARRGLIQQFDIPVVKGGELDGVIYVRDDEGVEQVAPYVRLSLVNTQGDLISSTRSEYDGYYLFNKILPGNYQIQVDTSTGRQRGTTPERLKQVKISNRGDLITDIDFVLRQLKSADGYIAKLGEFTSQGLLKVYFKLLSERAGTSLFSEAFYIESKQSNRYLLGAKYIEGQSQQAQQSVAQICQELHLLDVDCEVENVEFEY
jgi:hypothetical protein